RRPLGIGAGALALLSSLPDPEVHHIAQENASLLPSYGVPDVATLMQLVNRTRGLGYALHSARAAPGIKVIGMAPRWPLQIPPFLATPNSPSRGDGTRWTLVR